MLSGYWPALGNAWAVVSREGRVIVVAPEDEADLARAGFADEVLTFQAASLDRLDGVVVAVREPLAKALELAGGRALGYEHGASLEPATYVSTFGYGPAGRDLLLEARPRAELRPADPWLEELRLRKTRREIEGIRAICGLAERAYVEGLAAIGEGATERHVAAAFEAAFTRAVPADSRAHAFFYCMSGPNGFEAFRAYQHTRTRSLERGDSVLVHCNAALDGFWCDVTRSYAVGEAPEIARRMDAIREAREASFARIGPGAAARDVDAAVREALERRGFGDEIRHPAGHGVGFAAIDHDERPRLHPLSKDVLDVGVTFNVEPGLYREGRFGLRHCDMLAVTKDGYELLTAFQAP
jgi:Xaa-Pro aminopeptidase